VAVPRGDGAFVQLTGNQVGVPLGHHLLTEGAGGEGRAAGAAAMEQAGRRVVYGYEEALGYAALDLVRDKDGISAAVLFAELAAVCKARGTTILARLESLYRTFGFYASAQRSIALGEQPGASRIAMEELRKSPPSQLGKRAVRASRDHGAGAGELPPSNVLVYELEGDTRVVVGPSGTEPTLKLYVDHREPLAEGEALVEAEVRATREIDRIVENFARRVQTFSGRHCITSCPSSSRCSSAPVQRSSCSITPPQFSGCADFPCGMRRCWCRSDRRWSSSTRSSRRSSRCPSRTGTPPTPSRVQRSVRASSSKRSEKPRSRSCCCGWGSPRR